MKHNDDYEKLVDTHYVKQAKQHKLSLSSTMPDQNIRRLELQNIVKYLENERHCLEVGCGNGAASIEISKLVKINLFSIDSNREMIQLANRQPRSGIKGKVEFKQKNILKLNQKESFDTIFTIRCIINLLRWDDQKLALKNMANALKHKGNLILLEAFSDGLGEVNLARKEFGLDPILPAQHNLHLKKNDVVKFLSKNDLKIIKEDNFLSSYYFWTRVIYPVLAKANNMESTYNSRFDDFFSHFPPYGNFSHIKILVFQKNY